MSKRKFPEIMYEENQKIPFIRVEKDDCMNDIIFIAELKENGQTETMPDGSVLPGHDYQIHQFFNVTTMKQKLDTVTFDKVRMALGLENLEEATRKGQEISERVRSNIETISVNLNNKEKN